MTDSNKILNPAVSLALPNLFHTLTMASDICSEKSSMRKPSTVAEPSKPIDAFSHLVKGYPMLAGRIGVLPEMCMFRRFGALNARILLYLRDADSFSRMLGNHALDVLDKLNFLRWRKPNPKLGVISFNDQKIFKLTFWLTSAIACAIPVASIAVLTTVKSLSARLGTIAGFNALISLCLSFFTNARRTDVFSVTAA